MNKPLPYDKAVALLYAPGLHQAPKVVASGQGEIARTIIDRARAAGVPINSDPGLVELLAKVPLGDEIPVELYQAVAQLLAFVYRLDRSAAEALNPTP